MYQRIFFDVLEVSITVSIIVLITFFCLSMIDKRYGFKWRKFLWIVLAVRLLIPYNFTLPDTPIRLFQNEKIVVQEGRRVYLTEYSTVSTPENISKSEAQPIVGDDIEQKVQIPSEEAFQIPFLSLLGIIWGIGLFIYLRNQQMNYQYFLKDLDESISVTAGSKYELLQEICEKIHIKKIPDLYINEKVTTPFIIGYFRPVLFLPAKRYTRKELEFIYHHECTHYKSHDLLYKLVITIAVGIHWFNPIIHYMKTLAFRDVELVCDQKMAKALSNDEKRLYCNTLINTASGERFKELDLSTCFLGNKKILKQRIQNVFDKGIRKRGILPIFCILGMMLICGISISCGKDVKIPKPEKQAEKQTEKSEVDVTEEKQDSDTYVLPIASEKMKSLHLDKPFKLENYYCRQTRNARNDYKIDDTNALWEGYHILAENVKHISANGLNADSVLLYVTESGELYGVGSNADILFTDPLNPVVIDKPKFLMENVEYVACGSTSVTVLKKDGSVWVWGRYHDYGYTYIEGKEAEAENPLMCYPEPTCVLKNAIYVSANKDISAAITEKGELWTWGINKYGECGPSEIDSDVLKPEKRAEDVEFVWFGDNRELGGYTRELQRTFIKKNDGSFWACGETMGEKEKMLTDGPDAEVYGAVYTDEFVPIELEEK